MKKFTPGYLARRLEDQGFHIEEIVVDEKRKPRSDQSLEEWFSYSPDLNLDDKNLERALLSAHEELKEKVRKLGTFPRLSGEFNIYAVLK